MRERVTEWRVLRKDTVCSVAKHMNSEAPVQQFSKSVPCTRLGLMLIFFEDFCCFVYCQMDVLFFYTYTTAHSIYRLNVKGENETGKSGALL